MIIEIKMKAGDKYIKEFSISQEQVNSFAELTGDHNPIHLDEAYAASTPFKQRIVHGIFTATVFSQIVGMEFPGEGTIYLSQNLSFKRPVFPDKPYEARLEVTETIEGKHIATIKTEVYDKENGKLALTGEALVKNALKIK